MNFKKLKQIKDVRNMASVDLKNSDVSKIKSFVKGMKDLQEEISERNGLSTCSDVWSNGGILKYLTHGIDDLEIFLSKVARFSPVADSIRISDKLEFFDNWMGIEGATFYWNGEWNSPKVTYKGLVMNYNDIEDLFYKDDLDESYSWEDALNDAYYAEYENYIYNAKEILSTYREKWVNSIEAYLREYGEDEYLQLASDVLETIDISYENIENGNKEDWKAQIDELSQLYIDFEIDEILGSKENADNFIKFIDILDILNFND